MKLKLKQDGSSNFDFDDLSHIDLNNISDEGWPKDYLDPIDNKPMFDPVATVDGFVFDRRTISKWFKDHDKNPLTLTHLDNLELTPILGLKSRIQEFNRQHRLVSAVSDLKDGHFKHGVDHRQPSEEQRIAQSNSNTNSDTPRSISNNDVKSSENSDQKNQNLSITGVPSGTVRSMSLAGIVMSASQADKQKEHKIEKFTPIIFFEWHTSKKIFMLKLLENLRRQGYQAFIKERSDFNKIKDFIDKEKQILAEQRSILEDGGLAILSELLALNDKEQEAIKSLLTDDPYDLKEDDDPTIFTDGRWFERSKKLSKDHAEIASRYLFSAILVRQALVWLAIYDKVKALDFDCYGIDEPTHDLNFSDESYNDNAELRKYHSLRNEYMADKIIELSDKYNGKVIFILGAYHFQIQEILFSKKWSYGEGSQWITLLPHKAEIVDLVNGDCFNLPEESEKFKLRCPYGMKMISTSEVADKFVDVLTMQGTDPEKHSNKSELRTYLFPV